IWHGHDYKTNALGLLLKRFWPMRLVTTAHGWVHHTPRTPIYYKIDQLCLRRYEQVYCVSPDLHAECRAFGVSERRCILLENGIDETVYQRSQTIAAAQAKLGLAGKGFLIGAAGRLEKEKAFDNLIRAVAALRKQERAVHLVIVGEGSQRQALLELAREMQVSEHVTLAGWQSDVRTYFEAMDVFALSSLREGLPNVVLEAMALEVPVVVTKINGLPRLIESGVNGLLVPAGEVEPLTKALAGLLEQPEQQAKFRHAGRKTIETRYSFRQRMETLADHYDQLLGSPHRGVR
ncbi:MAG: glycosyltransferase, partial [Gemmataceae bacterium]